MSALGELAQIVGDSLITRNSPKQTAEAILAAGYRKPKVVPDEHFLHDENGKFPVKFKKGTIVESADGTIWRFDEGYWDSLGWGSASLRGPATVLYEPGARR